MRSSSWCTHHAVEGPGGDAVLRIRHDERAHRCVARVEDGVPVPAYGYGAALAIVEIVRELRTGRLVVQPRGREIDQTVDVLRGSGEVHKTEGPQPCEYASGDGAG